MGLILCGFVVLARLGPGCGFRGKFKRGSFGVRGREVMLRVGRCVSAAEMPRGGLDGR